MPRGWIVQAIRGSTRGTRIAGPGLLDGHGATVHNALQRLDPSRYSDEIMMRALVLSLALLATGLSVSLSADARGDAKAEVDFGVDVARHGLWREAIFRWERATQIDPTYAAAFNNLAVAYEHEGQLDQARQAYEKALAIEPNNVQIRQNYELFREINDRKSADREQP
jgi:tetratricopeptide (TPR) repeat protein